MNPTVRIEQVWGDTRTDMRELKVLRTDARHAYCVDDNGRKTRILLSRMVRGKGYYLKMENPARYVPVPSESTCACGGMKQYHMSEGCIHCANECRQFVGKPYQVWTGDTLSPAHCACEDFRWAKREPGERYLCKHLRFVLKERRIDETGLPL